MKDEGFIVGFFFFEEVDLIYSSRRGIKLERFIETYRYETDRFLCD